MDNFLAFVTAELERAIHAVGGTRAAQAALGAATWADILVMLCYLAGAAAIHAMVKMYLRHRMTRIPAAAPSTRHRMFTAAGRPLYIFIWVCGVYVAATPLLLKISAEQGVVIIRHVVDWVFDLVGFSALFWFLFRATHVVEAHLASWSSHTPFKTDDLVVPLLGSSLRVVVIVLAIILGIPLLDFPAVFADFIGKCSSILLILSLAILVIRGVAIMQRVVLVRFDMSAADNLRARQVYTQLHVISRVLYVTVGVFTVAAILMLFQEVRHVGTSLLASAGIVGIIAGFAAQKTLANLFAGFQIALAQPVRQDDVVVVEGEWGRVEEITLTYVIVHIWDDRRLVLPLSYFIEKPFQNWTRTSAAIMGSVFVWVDYSFPVDQAREALKGIIESNPLWDKRFWNLQVSDATDRTIQLRILATSSDSSRSWDLRCDIRERFVAYIQQHHVGALPHLRAEVTVANR